MVPGGQQGQGVTSHRVERHVTEIEHPGLADDHVEPDGQQDEHPDVLGQHVGPRALGSHDRPTASLGSTMASTRNRTMTAKVLDHQGCAFHTRPARQSADS